MIRRSVYFLAFVVVFAAVSGNPLCMAQSGVSGPECYAHVATNPQSVGESSLCGPQLVPALFVDDSGTAEKGNPNVKVWVNTNSGVYHCPGTRWYGNTKHGEYMTQKQAQEKGYRPAYGKVCR